MYDAGDAQEEDDDPDANLDGDFPGQSNRLPGHGRDDDDDAAAAAGITGNGVSLSFF